MSFEDLSETPENMPNVGPDNVVTDDEGDVLYARAAHQYKSSREHTIKWRSKAKEDFKFLAGNQWSSQDEAILQEMRRPPITFNRIGPVINMITGSEINNRQEIRYMPRQMGAAGVNQLLSDAARWIREECDAEDQESEAFKDMLTCGMGWIESRMDYEKDPDGKMMLERVDPFEMWWDPSAKKRNLEDAKFLMRICEWNRSDVEEMWPDADISNDKAVWSDNFGKDNSPHDAELAKFYREDQSERSNYDGTKLVICQYMWREKEDFYRTIDPTTGKLITLTEQEKEKVVPLMKALGNPLKIVKQKKTVYRQAFFCGKTLLEKTDSAYEAGFTVTALTGMRDEEFNTWYGIVRPMKDPQRWANKWLSQTLHIINSNAKGGLMAEKDAFDDIRKAEAQYAQSDSITWLKKDGLKKIQEKSKAEMPQGTMQLTEFAIAAIPAVSGVNPEAIGLSQEDNSGVLEYQRRQTAMTVLAGFFNSLRAYRKIQGRIMLYFIQNYISDGRLIRIGGIEDQKYVPLVRDKTLGEYDIVVDEVASSPNQKEQTWDVLMKIIPMAHELGIPIPPDIIDYLPVPVGLQVKWKQMIIQKQNAPPNPEIAAKAQDAQASATLKQAQALKYQADAAGSKANVIDTLHRLKSDIQLNDARADLADAQAIATIQDSDIDKLKALIAAHESARDTEQSNKQQMLAILTAHHGVKQAQAEVQRQTNPQN